MKILPDKCIELIFEQAGIIAVTDKEGKYIYVNQKWVHDTGIPKEEAIGKYNHDLFDGTKALTAIRTKKPIVGEPLVRTIQGNRDLPGVITYMPICYRDEVVGCFISSAFLNREQSNEFISKILKMKEENEYLRIEMKKRSGARYTTDDIIGESDPVKKLKQKIWAAAQSDATVLIEGETGTGKELIAHAIHSASERNIFPFVKVNCSAIPESLMESEFFGYVDGAFTGGRKGGNKGKFEMATSGTLFLDEISLLAASMQPKLLRVLQEKEVEPIGSSESINVDARVIVATNIPLKQMVKKNKFREDLYYRLNIIHIVMPPLRQRKDDIPLLVDYFIEKLNCRSKKNILGVQQEALKMLMEREWKGNVRELENVLERAVNSVRAECHYLSVTDFAEEELAYEEQEENPVQLGQGVFTSPFETKWDSKKARKSLGQRKECLERDSIVKALELCDNNKASAARMLGISRTLLYRKMEKYEINI